MGAIPTIYFIDDSATMREVIKIAFRRENINVVAYNDAATALGQIESGKPDIVITDVIMPDKDGYEVCQFIKQHPSLGQTPVILMSGVVNKSVAERAFSVKADELIRKPFQPQDLITRVRHLLKPGQAVISTQSENAANAAAALSSIFSAPAAQPAARAMRPMASPAPTISAMPVAAPHPSAQPIVVASAPKVAVVPPPPVTNVQAPAPVQAAASFAAAAPAVARTPMSASADVSKIKLEMLRLEGLVKKLQSELAAEREYSRALEEHVKTLQEND